MEETLYSRAREQGAKVTLARGTGWGLVGGFAGTILMDLLLMGALVAVGLPALACFSIVGNTVARFISILGLEMAGDVSLGVAAHYLIGPLIGATFGAATAQFRALQVVSLTKRLVLAIVYVELLSQPILATASVLLKMTTSDTFQWFGAAFPAHLIAGGVLGLVIHFRSPTRSAPH